MAIAAPWVVESPATIGTTAVQLYTVPSTTAATSYYPYARDLIVNNGGSLTLFVGLSASGTVATSAASFQVPPGGTVILTQCQVPQGAVVSALVGSGSTGQCNIGYGTNVSYV